MADPYGRRVRGRKRFAFALAGVQDDVIPPSGQGGDEAIHAATVGFADRLTRNGFAVRSGLQFRKCPALATGGIDQREFFRVGGCHLKPLLVEFHGNESSPCAVQ